jgi:hypothetical protein
MRDGELDLIALLLEIHHHPRGFFGAIVRRVLRLEGVGQTPRRVMLQHFAADDQLAVAVKCDR